MFDDDYLHEHPPAYHAVESLHFSFNDEILNDKGKQEYFQALIDQRPIHNNSPSRVHNVENPLQFEYLWNTLKHNLIMITHCFHDYFSVLELNVSTNMSFIDPIQSGIY
jgi:hypothetical protein